MSVKQAMILAAGLGTRMQHLTKDIPKPMVEVDGVSLIERHLRYLYLNNIHKIVINAHYKAEIFESFVKSLPIASKLEIYFSREEELLGTAGGVKNALNLLGEDPFFVINSDAMFVDQDQKNTSFIQLEKYWQTDYMPMMILLVKKNKAFGYRGNGDFDMDEEGKISRDNAVREFVNPGMYIMDYKVFQPYEEMKLDFFNVLIDLMEKQKLYGCLYQGEWYHIGDLKAHQDYAGIK
jgi:MurNAc alpha-1-phosphate uridylyltransferase